MKNKRTVLFIAIATIFFIFLASFLTYAFRCRIFSPINKVYISKMKINGNPVYGDSTSIENLYGIPSQKYYDIISKEWIWKYYYGSTFATFKRDSNLILLNTL